MSLFNKKLSLDDILKGIDELSDEEKAKVKAKMEDVDKAEDEREIDKIEEDKGENAELKDEKADEVKEESEEIGKDVDEVKSEVADGEDVAQTEEKADETVDKENSDKLEEYKMTEETEELNGVEEENKEDAMSGLADRVSELEAKIEELIALKDKMEEYTRKQADKFGYKGGLPRSKKDYGDMTADELAKELKSEI